MDKLELVARLVELTGVVTFTFEQSAELKAVVVKAVWATGEEIVGAGVDEENALCDAIRNQTAELAQLARGAR